MSRIFVLIFGVVLLTCSISSCSEDKKLECSIRINNKDLKEAIIDYQNFLYKDRKKDIERGDSFYVGVISKDINDSIFRYYLYPVDFDMFEYLTPSGLGLVNGHYVIISYLPVYASLYPKNEKFIGLSEEAHQYYLKTLFPKEYKKRKDGNLQNGVIDIYEPDNCYLTFLRDSLIDKTFVRGLACDKILIKLNGKEVYL